MDALTQYLNHHHLVGVLAWLVVTGTVNAFFRKYTPEQWLAFVEKNKRAAALIQFFRAIGFDPIRLLYAFKLFVEFLLEAEVTKKDDHDRTT